MMDYLWCILFGHQFQTVAKSFTHTYHKCDRCGESNTYKRPQPVKPREPEYVTLDCCGHQYERGTAHDCECPNCPAGVLPT